MLSHEVLRRAAEPIGIKALAARLRLSPAMVYKWCQESGKDDPDASGARNPLDRLAEIYRATGSVDVINWLCHEADGFFVSNPRPTNENPDTVLIRHTQRLVTEFSHLLLTVTKSLEDDGMIEPREADNIRAAWETLKSSAESFAVACERGAYFGKNPGDLGHA
jgi:hypothetical protein